MPQLWVRIIHYYGWLSLCDNYPLLWLVFSVIIIHNVTEQMRERIGIVILGFFSNNIRRRRYNFSNGFFHGPSSSYERVLLLDLLSSSRPIFLLLLVIVGSSVSHLDTATPNTTYGIMPQWAYLITQQFIQFNCKIG